MRRHAGGRRPLIAVMVACFLSGVAVDWWLRENGPPLPAVAVLRPTEVDPTRSELPVAPSGGRARAAVPGDPVPIVQGPVDRSPVDAEPVNPEPVDRGLVDPIEELHRHHLRLPLDGMVVESLKGDFARLRGGRRPHEAVDVLTPRHTPVHAVEDGTIAKLFLSRRGGHTVYQFDPSRRFAYYYAHLERYADGLREGQRVARGEVIGYAGTSGNAPPGTPHLHFTVFELTSDRQWWRGTAIDPYLIFSR